MLIMLFGSMALAVGALQVLSHVGGMLKFLV